ncbi:hypothetical protein B566_EDAN004548 [Ephemera danica]|nr:hypothetical protein B566_EDAN004548 [Ephemera danica]
MAYPGGASGGYPGGYGGAYPGGGAGAPGGYPGSAGAPGGYPGQAQPGGYPGHHGGYPGGQPQPGGYPGHASAGYPGAAPPSGVSPEVQGWFQAVDRDRSGKIDARELQSALMNGQGKCFSDTACTLMIGMFDKDKSGTIDLMEFQQLYNYINQWLSAFKAYDRDQSGFVDEGELNQALQQMGYRFTPQFVNFLVTRSDPATKKKISVDQFIVICVQIQRFTEAFRGRDREMKGVISIGFEDFLQVALSSSV